MEICQFLKLWQFWISSQVFKFDWLSKSKFKVIAKILNFDKIDKSANFWQNYFIFDKFSKKKDDNLFLKFWKSIQNYNFDHNKFWTIFKKNRTIQNLFWLFFSQNFDVSSKINFFWKNLDFWETFDFMSKFPP